SFQNGSGIMISGYKKYGSTTEFVIIIKHTAPVTTGTYVENSVGDPLVTMTYFYDVFLGAGTQYSSFHSTSRPAMVIISEMSASSIRGAFEGELHGHDSSGEAKNLQVTNGVFYVSFKP
ncbi:MAG TPA: hypothetical protein VFP87_09375, partial [Chitinophagaceae bacterium]|nr:hypothetical protein [Chitinophagaceae bacterium]